MSLLFYGRWIFIEHLNHRPAAFEISEVQFLFKHLNKLGSASFRGALTALLPFPTIQKLRELIDIIEVESKKILADKRTALQAGDDVVVRQVGEGKDIMSILCEFYRATTRSFLIIVGCLGNSES